MLENPALLLTRDEGLSGSSGRREWHDVHSSADGARLGRVAIDPVAWLPWRMRWHLQAFEGPEDSELFTSRRAGWAPRDWDVFDADGRIVALLRGSFVLGAGGDILGQRRARSPTHPGAVINPDGVRVGSWNWTGSRCELRFSIETPSSPFLRMAIMVAALLDPSV